MILSYLLNRIDEDKKRDVIFGLAFGLIFGLAFGFFKIVIPSLLFPYWIFLVLTVIAMELLFLFDKRKPKPRENILWFTFKIKFEAFFESILILTNIVNAIYLIEVIEWSKYYEPIVQVFSWIVCFVGVIGFLLIYLYLNSLRYKKVEEVKTKRRRKK